MRLLFTVKVKSLSRVRLFVTPWTVAYQAPPSVELSRQDYWSGVPLLLRNLSFITTYFGASIIARMFLKQFMSAAFFLTLFYTPNFSLYVSLIICFLTVDHW